MQVSTVEEMKLVEICSLEEIPEQIGKLVSIGKHEIALFRLGDNTVKAVENRCPHKGGPLDQGMVSGNYVYCPLHDWKICLEDGKVQEPDEGCVRTYPVEVEGNRVFIRL
jgi:nitrite reductase (NADH) small subunit